VETYGKEITRYYDRYFIIVRFKPIKKFISKFLSYPVDNGTIPLDNVRIHDDDYYDYDTLLLQDLHKSIGILVHQVLFFADFFLASQQAHILVLTTRDNLFQQPISIIVSYIASPLSITCR
jgi:hypothetical protein